MDEQDLIKGAMEVVLRPIVSITEDVLGRAGGDWLHEVRTRNRKRLHDRTEELLRNRKVTDPVEPSTNVLLPILAFAQDEQAEEVLEFWAQLLASSIDKERRKNFRKRFVDAISQMDALDARVMSNFRCTSEEFEYRADRRREFAVPPLPRMAELLEQHIPVPEARIQVSLENLARLGLLSGDFRRATAFGTEFLDFVLAS